MTTLDQLIDFQSNFRSCETIAYADLSSKMVLCSTSLVKMRQEQLDGLCASAAEFLNSEAVSEIPKLFDCKVEQPRIDHSITVSGEFMHVFVRSPQDSDEAICAICKPTTDIDDFVVNARKMLSEIGSDTK